MEMLLMGAMSGGMVYGLLYLMSREVKFIVIERDKVSEGLYWHSGNGMSRNTSGIVDLTTDDYKRH